MKIKGLEYGDIGRVQAEMERQGRKYSAVYIRKVAKGERRNIYVEMALLEQANRNNNFKAKRARLIKKLREAGL